MLKSNKFKHLISLCRYTLLLFLWLVSYSGNTANDNNEAIQGLLFNVQQIQDRHHLPAVALILVSPDHDLIHFARGLNQDGTTRTIAKDAYFRLGSITKTFVSLSALVAQEKKLLSLNDPLRQFVRPGLYRNPYQDKQTISLAMLLEHTAGFKDMSKEEFDSNKAMPLEQALAKFANNHQVHWQPGCCHSYSNLGYGFAGAALEQATKKSMQQWLSESVFKPLTMASATLAKSTAVTKKLELGYETDGKTRIPYWHMVYASLGAINVQIDDMKAFLRLFLQPSRSAFPSSFIARMEQPKTSWLALSGFDYGYGLGLYQWYHDGALFYGHGGDADGYLSQFAYQKQANLGYFFVITSFNKTAKRAIQKLLDTYIATFVKTQYKAPVKFSMPGFEGKYKSITSRFGGLGNQTIELKEDNQQWFIKVGSRSWQHIIPTDSGAFRYPMEPDASIKVFSQGQSIYLHGDLGNFERVGH